MEGLLKEIKEHYIEQPNVKRGKFYIEALTLEEILSNRLEKLSYASPASSGVQAAGQLPTEIKEGDFVDVHCEHTSLYNYEVLYKPVATGDSWRLREKHTNKLIYLQTFGYMERRTDTGLPF